MIGQTISHYKVTEKLGGGGMGVVYKAEDTKLNRPVALKFIHPHLTSDEPLKKRFLREAQLASSLDHPNICNIYEIDEAPDGRLFFSMAYYDGESLAERAKRAPLPSREVFQICFSIAQGLSCAHRNGIIHRDIKPGNIIITEEGFIKIVDFGLAKLSEGSTRLTKTDTTVGTVRYMSPEQATDKDVDHRSDIWSLGVMLYELASGQSPFRGDIDAAIFYSILHDDPAPVNEINSKIPEACANIISRCLEKDVEKRYQSVDELLEDMGALARELGWGSSIAGLTLPVVGKGYYRKPGHRLRIAGGIAAVVVVIAALIIWWQMREVSLYTTDMRLAVMPLVNKTHPDNDRCVTGLTDIVCDMLVYTGRQHESMWIVPNRLVRFAKLANQANAKEAFGVNRILTGNMQRYLNRQMLLLELRDAETLEKIRSESISFDIGSPAVLTDSLLIMIENLVGIDHAPNSIPAAFLPMQATLIKPYLEGVGALAEKDFDSAISALTKISADEPEFSACQTALGWAQWLNYRKSGDDKLLASSIDHLKSSIRISPNNWRAKFYLGEIYRLTDDSENAIASYQSALLDDPFNPLASRGLSRVYRSQQRLSEAEIILQDAIAERPDYFETHRMLALAFYRMGNEDEAVQNLRRTLSYAPSDAYSLNTLGVIYHDRKNHSEARKYFEKAFQLLPNCDTCFSIGLILYFEKKYKESASYYELSLEYCGEDDYRVWGNWASSLFWVENERERAIEIFHKAIELATDELKQKSDISEDPLLIGNLIEYYAMIGDEDNSRRLIEQAKPLAEHNEEVMYSIGDAYEIFGDRTAALRYLGNAIRHGFPVDRIEATRELADLVQTRIFQQLVATDAEQDPNTSEHSN